MWPNLPSPDRYDRFLENIKHLGPASVTEMLASKVPDQCAIWNDKARKALTILGFEGQPAPDEVSHHWRGTNARFNNLCRAIADELAVVGLPKPDLFGVDYFLYEVAQSAPGTVVTEPRHRTREVSTTMKSASIFEILGSGWAFRLTPGRRSVMVRKWMSSGGHRSAI